MSAILETPVQPVLVEQTTSFYIPIEDDDSTVFSNHAAHVNEMITYSKKRYSDGYRSLMKASRSRQGNGKPTLFEYFTTKNIIGHPIRNARTGYLYPQYCVGRIHEYLFFKVRLSNEDSYQANQFMFSKYPHQNTHNPNEKDKPDLDVLFYDSPEEYESHHQIQLSHESKHQWRTRYEKLIRFMEKNIRKTEPQQPQQQQPQQESTKILLQPHSSETPSNAPPGLTNYPIHPSSPDYPPPDLVV